MFQKIDLPILFLLFIYVKYLYMRFIACRKIVIEIVLFRKQNVMLHKCRIYIAFVNVFHNI